MRAAILLLLIFLLSLFTTMYGGSFFLNKITPTKDLHNFVLTPTNIIQPTLAIRFHNIIVGSGLFISYGNRPLIITARHVVVADEALKMAFTLKEPIVFVPYDIEVGFWSNNQLYFLPAKITYVDDLYDLAFLRIREDGWPPEVLVDMKWKLRPAELSIEVGASKILSGVIASGYPLGADSPLFTRGLLGCEVSPGLFSFTAPITNGNSGGPIFNTTTGKVLGIVVGYKTINGDPVNHAAIGLSSEVIREVLNIGSPGITLKEVR